MPAGDPDLTKLEEENKEAFKKAHDWVEGMRAVQDHENGILGE